jgi:hypothetical protein
MLSLRNYKIRGPIPGALLIGTLMFLVGTEAVSQPPGDGTKKKTPQEMTAEIERSRCNTKCELARDKYEERNCKSLKNPRHAVACRTDGSREFGRCKEDCTNKYIRSLRGTEQFIGP